MSYQQFRNELKNLPISEIEEMFPQITDKGIKTLSWTTGEQQNSRYDLSKQVEWINAEKTNKGDYKIEVGHKGNRPMETQYLKESELEANLGKELATKIIENNGGMYKGLDLKVGGKGMIGFYGSPTEGKEDIVKEFTREGGNKVVDDKGNPLEVYHGTTTKDFVGDKFVIGWDVQGLSGGAENIGVFFGNKKQAEEVSNGSVSYGAEVTGKRVIKSYINLKNPLQLTKDAEFWYSPERVLDALETDRRVNIKELRQLVLEHEKQQKTYIKKPLTATEEFEVENDTVAQVIRPYLEEKGFDGIIYDNQVDAVNKKGETSGKSYIVFNVDNIINTNTLKQQNIGIVGSVAKALIKELTGKDGKIVETKIDTGEKGRFYDEIILSQNRIDEIAHRQSEIEKELKGGKGNDNALADEYNSLQQEKQTTIEHIGNLNRRVSENQRTDNRGKLFNQSTQHSIEITPELKAAVQQGIPQFQIIGERGAKDIDEKTGTDYYHRLEQAKAMSGKSVLFKNASTKEIFNSTGWEKGSDGKWRTSVYPLRAKIKEIKIGIYEITKLFEGGVFDAYPGLKKYSVNIIDSSSDFLGKISTEKKEIVFNVGYFKNNGKGSGDNRTNRLADFESTVIHEVQHYVQKEEMFNKGANIGLYDNVIKYIKEYKNAPLIKRLWTDVVGKLNSLRDKRYKEIYNIIKQIRTKGIGSLDSFQLYQITSGEVEARLASYISMQRGLLGDMFPNKTLSEWRQEMIEKEGIGDKEISINQVNDQFQIIGERGIKNVVNAAIKLQKLAIAKEMFSQGKSRKEIFVATGWEKGGDNKWKTEISDISFNDLFANDGELAMKIEDNGGLKLSELVSGEVLSAYPEIGDVFVKFKKGKVGEGSFSQDKNEITINYNSDLDFVINEKEMLGALVHEIQHYVQHKEGFATGATPYDFIQDTLDFHNEFIYQDFIDKDLSPEEYIKVNGSIIDTLVEDGKEELIETIRKGKDAVLKILADAKRNALATYMKVAGEVEARNVMKRMDMPLADRVSNTFLDTEDVAEDEKIYLFGRGTADSIDKGGNELVSLADEVGEILSGRAIYKRFSQEEQQGFRRGGKIHVEASIIAGRGSRSGKTNDQRNDRQEKLIEQYAKEGGIWIPVKELYKKYGDTINSGKESLVFYNNNGYVIKTSNTLQYRTLEEALDSITLHNTIFPESNIEVIGFGKLGGDFQIITKQPYIIAGDKKISQDDIDKYISKLGLNKHNDGLPHNYKNDYILLRDMHVDNVILTKKGNIIPIDTILRLNTKELGGIRDISHNVESSNNAKIEIAKNNLKQAWANLKAVGVVSDPYENAKRMKAVIDAAITYVIVAGYKTKEDITNAIKATFKDLSDNQINNIYKIIKASDSPLTNETKSLVAGMNTQEALSIISTMRRVVPVGQHERHGQLLALEKYITDANVDYNESMEAPVSETKKDAIMNFEEALLKYDMPKNRIVDVDITGLYSELDTEALGANKMDSLYHASGFLRSHYAQYKEQGLSTKSFFQTIADYLNTKSGQNSIPAEFIANAAFKFRSELQKNGVNNKAYWDSIFDILNVEGQAARRHGLGVALAVGSKQEGNVFSKDLEKIEKLKSDVEHLYDEDLDEATHAETKSIGANIREESPIRKPLDVSNKVRRKAKSLFSPVSQEAINKVREKIKGCK